jgi:hypothetical protein
MKTNRLFNSVRTSLMRITILVGIVLSGLVTFGHGVQLRWNIVPSTGAIRVWVEHWHGDVSGSSYTTFPLNVSYTVAGVTTSQTYYATGYSNNTSVTGLPAGGSTSTLLSACSGNANYYNDWVYWDFNPPACNTPVALTIISGPSYLTAAGCATLYNRTIYSNFNDNSGPAITANDIYVSPTNASNCTAIVNNYGVTAVDACGGINSTTYSIAQGSSFSLGSTPVIVTSTDANSNTSTATFNVIVGDNIAPTVLIQNATVALVNGTASVTGAQIDNGSYDNACGGIASLVVSPSSFSCNSVGANTVTLTVTDISGNVSTDTATVTVTSDLTASATASDANCFEACDGSVALNISGGTAPYGIITGDLNQTFTGTAIDNSVFTYTGSYSQNGTLSTNAVSNNYWVNVFRTTATMTRTAGKTFEFKYYSVPNHYNMIGWYGTNSLGASNQYQNLVHSFYFAGGSLYTFEDGSNLYNAFPLTNNSWYDCKIELLATGANYYIKAANSSNYTLVHTSTSSSESDLSPAMTYYGYTGYNGPAQTDDWVVGNGGSSNTTNLCAGNYNMTIMDASGCTSDVTFTVNEPSAALATGITANLSACSTENYTISSGTTTGGTAPYTYSWNMGDGTTLTGATVNHVYTSLGAKTITLTATDANGCSDVQTSSTSVLQCNVAPVAVCQNISVQTDANCQAVVAANAIDGGSTDANGDVMTFTMSPAGPFSVGTYNVTLTVSDPAGLSSTCASTITVSDSTAPMAIAQNVTVQLDASGNGSTTATAVNNGSSDACGVATMTINNASFTCANVGSNNTVMLTVTDVNGNVSFDTATVTVEDNVHPVAVAQNVTVQLDALGNGSTTAALVNNGSSDACGVATMTINNASFTCANVGSNNTVMLTVTDVNGNVSFDTATVTVEDNVHPVAVAQNVTVQLDALGNGSTTAALVNNGSSDACGVATMTIDSSSFTCANVGSNITVMLTVTDVNGNVSFDTATVTVEDNIVPVFAGIPSDITVSCSNVPAPAEPTATDNCDVDVDIVLVETSTTNGCGDNILTRTWTATDNIGNLTVASQVISISSIDLGVLEDFSLYTVSGAISNAGQSAITGDIGTHLGIISGFPTNMNGVQISNANTTTAQAREDLLKLYISLNSMHVDYTIPAVLTGLTFTSGVYRIATAGSVGGTVTLDALGDPDAVFIFKFEGAFTMGAGASILLMNGAKAENVFWIAEGASSIGASANVIGTLIAHPGAVSMGVGCTLNGRMLSTSGAITLATGTVTRPQFASTIPTECGAVCTNSVLGANISNFTLFSSAGAVANTGISGIVGDIGTNVGAVSGWGTSVVCGNTYNQDAITQSAKNELDAAYVSLNSMSSMLHAATYGSGETITPGVYSVAAAGSVAGELTLSGDGFYLFKFGGAFSTGAGTKVILENGAQACNVFWLAEGAISMGAFTSMRGTTIAHNGANNMGANGAIEGRMFSTAGAVGFYTATAFKDKVFCGAPSPQQSRASVAGPLSTSENGDLVSEEFEGSTIEVILYPNPSINDFTVVVESDRDELVTVEVFDLAGNLVQRVEGQFTYSEIVMGQYLASGVYVVVVQQGDFRTVLRAVKGN